MMTMATARPTATIAVPDEREGSRILPTATEAWVVDLYAEGYSHRHITAETDLSKSQQARILGFLGVPLAYAPCAANRPRLLTDAELLIGERAANRRMDAIADARLAADAAALAAWEKRRAVRR